MQVLKKVGYLVSAGRLVEHGQRYWLGVWAGLYPKP